MTPEQLRAYLAAGEPITVAEISPDAQAMADREQLPAFIYRHGEAGMLYTTEVHAKRKPLATFQPNPRRGK